VALLLMAKGITRVRPLEGGIDAWLEHNFPFDIEDRKSINGQVF
jgi:hypothetical protein